MNNLILTANETMMRVMLEGGAGGGGSASAGFIKEFFTNVGKYVKSLGSYIVVIIGIALIMTAAWMLFKAFSSGNSHANWVVIVLCLFVGGVLAFGGWKLITEGQYSGLGKDTMDELMKDGPEAATFNDSGSGNTCLAKARSALGIIASDFILPFGTALAVCTGAALVLLAIIQVAKFFFAGGRAQMSWLKVGAMFVIGVVMFVGTGEEGFKWANKIGIVSKNTIINMSDGSVGDDASGLDYGDLSTYDPGDGSNMSADPDDV